MLSLYRSPSTSVQRALEDLEAILTALSPHVCSIIIAGDLNVDLLSDDGHSTAYTNLLSDFYLTQHVVGPSRVTATSSTLIDHIVSSSQVPVLRYVD